MTNELQWQEDLALVQRTLAGDERAISELAARMNCIAGFLNSMNRQAHHPLRKEKLEDAGQEVAARIWRDRELFTGQSRLETWVYPYAHHVFRETAASQRRVEFRRADHDTIHSLHSAGPTPAETLDVQSESKRVRQAMASMEPDLVVLIEQHLQLGYSFAAIADKGGLNVNTVKARYYRGMGALREKLGTSLPSRRATSSHGDGPP